MAENDTFEEYIENAYEAFGDASYLRAENYYKKALAIKEINAEGYCNLAICYLDNYMFEKAEVFLKKALALDPTNKNTIKVYCDFLFYYKQEKTKAEENYLKLLHDYPEDESLYAALATIYENYYEDWTPNYEKAIAVFKTGIKNFPNADYLSSILLRIYVTWGTFKEAERFFKKLQKSGKCIFNDYEVYASLFSEEKDTDSLMKVLKDCISYYPRETQFYKEIINLHAENENLDLVIATYEKLFIIDCDNLDNYYDLAKYLLEKGELNKANQYYKTAANINYSKVLFEQAYFFSNPPFDHYIKAIELYKEVVKLSPNNFRAYVNMGVCAGFLQRYHESLSYYSKAIEINPHYDLPYENSGNACRKTGDLKLAINYYKKALHINSENYKVASNLGVTYYSLGKYKEALKFYETSLKFSGNQSILAYYNIALLYNKQKKYTKAIDACQNALELYNEQTPSEALFYKYAIYYTLGLSHLYLKNKDEALTHFFKSLELNENYKDTYVNIGCIYNDFKKLDLAKENLNKALQMDPQDACALENLGWNSYLAKDYTKALKYTKKSVQLDPNNADAFYNLGKIYSATKKEEKAKKMFEKAALLGCKKAAKLV
jgi:tetratricopeptide (TPR) repeat protein